MDITWVQSTINNYICSFQRPTPGESRYHKSIFCWFILFWHLFIVFLIMLQIVLVLIESQNMLMELDVSQIKNFYFSFLPMLMWVCLFIK